MSPPRLHPALDAWGEYPEQRGPARLHWGHGDGVVLRGRTELPVLLGPQSIDAP